MKVIYDPILGQTRMKDEGTASYASIVYGTDLDCVISTSSLACKKIVLNQDHDSYGDSLRYTQVDAFGAMPAHNWKRCVVSNNADRTIVYFLNPSDSTKKEDGTASVLTGADGDVMVKIPKAYFRYDIYTDGNGHMHMVTLVSDKMFNASAVDPYFFVGPGGATERDYQLVGAFRSVLCDASGVAKAQTGGTPASYATGNKFRSIAGVRAHGGATRAVYRAGHVANGGTSVNDLFHQFMLRMMAIDGCTYNTQEGISVGYTNCQSWYYEGVRQTGRTACFGNGTGAIVADDLTSDGVDYDILTMKNGATNWTSAATADHSLRVVQFSYRGVEDPFGSQWCFADGIQKNQNAVADDYSQSGYWITTDTSKYNLCDSDMGTGSANLTFPSCGYTGSAYAWVSQAWPKVAGYVKDFDRKTIYAKSFGGSSSTYLGDYIYNDANAGARCVSRGGNLYDGTSAGLGYVNVFSGLSSSGPSIGSRLAA